MFARLFLAAFTFTSALLGGVPARSADLLPEELILMLQGGGYLVFVNHIETLDETTIALSVAPDLQCAHPTTLTPLGEAKARAMGGGFERLDIPIREIVASPSCGAWTMARLAFGRQGVSVRPEDHVLRKAADPVAAEPLIDADEASREGPPPVERVGNRIVVGKTATLQAIVPDASAVPGAAHVMRRGDDGLVLTGIIPPDAWLGF